MSSTIDVIIKDVTLVLPLFPDSTVSSISEAAIQEYHKFQLRDHPQKVLYTKDHKGRVLSGSLQLPLQGASAEPLSVIVQDYSQKDSASPAEVLKLYRDWQLWSAAQLKDHIQYLSYRESPLLPENTVFQLLEELSRSPNEEVQSSCLSSYRFLLCKFPQKSVVMRAAEQISQIFAAAKSADIAVFALESFRDLSPLQMKLFDSSRFVRDMIDIQHHLIRFPVEARSILFEAFENIVALIEDEELVVYFQSKKAMFERNAEESEALAITEGEINGELSAALSEESVSPPTGSTNQTKKWNLSRLLSLMTSEDTKIKHYSLEKVKKVLISSLDERKQVKSKANRGKYNVKTPESSTGENNIDDDSYWIVFRDEDEFQKLVLALFTCLKSSIRGRQSGEVPQPLPTQGLSTAGRLITVALTARDTDVIAVRYCIECLYLIYYYASHIMVIGAITTINGKSGRKSATLSAVQNSRNGRSHKGRSKNHSRHEDLHHRSREKQVNPLTGRPLSHLQRLCTAFGREFHRLLFTLSHASEILCCYQQPYGGMPNRLAIDPFILEEIAERSAFLFAMVVLHHQPPVNHMNGQFGSTMIRGWASSALQPEHISLTTFLGLRKPCYRLYLALTYLLHLAATHQEAISSSSNAATTSNSSTSIPSSSRLKEGKTRRLSASRTLLSSADGESFNAPIDNNNLVQALTINMALDQDSSLPSGKKSDMLQSTSSKIGRTGVQQPVQASTDFNNTKKNVTNNSDLASASSYASRLEELLCQDHHALLRGLWWWCVADARRDTTPHSNSNHYPNTATTMNNTASTNAASFASNFLVRRFAWRVLAEASITVRVAENLWQTQVPPVPSSAYPASLAVLSTLLTSSSSSSSSSSSTSNTATTTNSLLKNTVEVIPFLLTLISRAYRYVPPTSATFRRNANNTDNNHTNRNAVSRRKWFAITRQGRQRVTFVSMERANGVCQTSSYGPYSSADHNNNNNDSIEHNDDNDSLQSPSHSVNNSDDEDHSDSDSDGNDNHRDHADDDFMSEDSYSDREDGAVDDTDYFTNAYEEDTDTGASKEDFALHHWSRYHAQYGFKIRIDYHLLRALLKTLSNVLQVTPLATVYFPTKHRQKLRHYLQHMVIGDDIDATPKSSKSEDENSDSEDDHTSSSSSRGGDQSKRRQLENKRRMVRLEEVAERDRIVGVYYQLLLELLQLPVIEEEGNSPLASTTQKKV